MDRLPWLTGRTLCRLHLMPKLGNIRRSPLRVSRQTPGSACAPRQRHLEATQRLLQLSKLQFPPCLLQAADGP